MLLARVTCQTQVGLQNFDETEDARERDQAKHLRRFITPRKGRNTNFRAEYLDHRTIIELSIETVRTYSQDAGSCGGYEYVLSKLPLPGLEALVEHIYRLDC